MSAPYGMELTSATIALAIVAWITHTFICLDLTITDKVDKPDWISSLIDRSIQAEHLRLKP